MKEIVKLVLNDKDELIQIVVYEEEVHAFEALGAFRGREGFKSIRESEE